MRTITTTEKKKDYLAVITVGSAGSWAREPDKEKAIKSVVRIFKRDFSRYFELKKGEKIKIDVIDVTGHGKVWWDDRCFYTGDGDKTPFTGPVERVERTL